MSIVAYLIYILTAFSLYMLWILGSADFVKLILPWVVFMAVIFAPLVWMARKDRSGIR